MCLSSPTPTLILDIDYDKLCVIMATFEAEPLLHSEGADHVEESKYLKLSTVIGWVAQYRVYVCIFLLKFCMTFYIYIFELPLVRLVERAICQTYYKSLPSNPDWQDVDEAMCKLPVIQDKLAYIMGFRLTFNAIPGLPRSNPIHLRACLLYVRFIDVSRLRISGR